MVVPQSTETAIVESATSVLNEIMATPARGIPQALLHDAQAIIIAPGLLKGGLVIGVRYGRGVLVMRDDNGGWRAPSFVTITGGSIGWQIGVQSTDIVMVFKTKQGVQRLVNGKFAIGGDVSAAAGPVGREASAATDVQLRAEIYSYSRSRGLFAGAALDGTVVSLDNSATAAYYRGTGLLFADALPGQPPRLPASAATLLATIAAYSGFGAPAVPVVGAAVPIAAAAGVAAAPTAGAPGSQTNPFSFAPGAMPAMAPVAGDAIANGSAQAAPGVGQSNSPLVQAPALAVSQLPADLEAVRGRLADASRRLTAKVDPRWQSYLALPQEIYNPGPAAKPETISGALARFNAVAEDAKYRPLTQRSEFQETFGLLKAYRDLQTAGNVGTVGAPG
jgi:lipid-binding SYLF domain-containing protein